MKSKQNPRYWDINGVTAPLVGGSKEDNLFQIDRLEEHLDSLVSWGGNYIRCTMSSRDEGDVWPFEKTARGLYDLEKPSREYWDKFSRLLSLCDERGIIVQIELWDRFDFAREPWKDNPYNPQNNLNYTTKESGLAEGIDSHPSQNENRFFYTVPALDNNEQVLAFQKKQVDRLLELSLPYGNVLYCMDNETCGHEEWGKFWCLYVRDAAKKAGREVHTTEMWDDWDLTTGTHGYTFDHPEYYTFCDVSQNNQQRGDTHWRNFALALKRTADAPRPHNCVKTYGSDADIHGNLHDGQERFWLSLLAGAAAVRFHRPPHGLGLSPLAQNHIRSVRLLLEKFPLTKSRPADGLLRERKRDNSFLIAGPRDKWALLFTGEGRAVLDLSPGGYDVFPLNLARAEWEEPFMSLKADEKGLGLDCPGGFLVYVVERRDAV